MKTFSLFFVIILLFNERIQSQTWENILEFGSGYLTGHMAHEMGHQLTSSIVGLPIRWELNDKAPSFLHWDSKPNLHSYFDGITTQEEWEKVMSSPVKKKRDMVGLGGFGAEIVSSEIIFATTDIKRTDESFNYYALGWLTMTIVNPIVYTILDASKETNVRGIGGYGDLGRISTINKGTIRVVIIGHAILNVIRLGLILDDDKNDDIDMYTSLNMNSASFSLAIKF